MCGRFAISETANELIVEFVAQGGDFRDWKPSYSVAPTDPAPIVRERKAVDSDAPARFIELADWGFRPGWAKPKSPAPINARLEKVATGGLFTGALTSQRCLVPMTGYYEWEETVTGKQPHFIHGDGILAAAGLYASRKEDDVWKISFTVITRTARDASGEIHDRMPAFLAPDSWGNWLNPEKLVEKDDVLAMLDRSSATVAAILRSHTVDRRVNSVRTVDPQDPSIIEPIAV